MRNILRGINWLNVVIVGLAGLFAAGLLIGAAGWF